MSKVKTTKKGLRGVMPDLLSVLSGVVKLRTLLKQFHLIFLLSFVYILISILEVTVLSVYFCYTLYVFWPFLLLWCMDIRSLPYLLLLCHVLLYPTLSCLTLLCPAFSLLCFNCTYIAFNNVLFLGCMSIKNLGKITTASDTSTILIPMRYK